MRELLGEPVGLDVVSRQLVDAVEERGKPDEGTVRKDVRLQVRSKCVGNVALERADGIM